MAQFDVHRSASGAVVLLLSSELVAELPIVPVALLQPSTARRSSIRGLEPTISGGDLEFRLTPYFLASLLPGEIGPLLFSAESQRDEIIRALNLMLTGI